MKEHAICTRSNSFYLQLVSVTTSTRDKEKCKGRKFSLSGNITSRKLECHAGYCCYCDQTNRKPDSEWMTNSLNGAMGFYDSKIVLERSIPRF